jgi:uncharacterized cupin superfamily protein
VLGTPAGKIAHQIVNTGQSDPRYLAVATNGSFDVVEYPDSAKFGVAAGMQDADFRTATFLHIAHSEPSVDYWEGE